MAQSAAAAGGCRGGGGGAAVAATPPACPESTAPASAASPKTKPCRSSRSSWNPGGSIVTIGSSTSVAGLLGIPVKNYLTEMGPDGKERPLPREKFYIPGSLLKVNVDNTNPLAYGMPAQVDVFFDSSPVFKLEPDAALKKTAAGGLVLRPRGAG